MQNHLIKLFKHTIFYGIGQMGSRLVAVVLIPLYTAYLTPSDYGVLQIVRIVGSLLLGLMLLGMGTSMFRVYFKAKSDTEKNLIVNSTIITYIITSIVIFVPILFLTLNFSNVIIKSPSSSRILIMVFFSVFIEGIHTLQLAVLRAEERSKLYSFMNILRILIYIGMIVFLVVSLNRNYMGVIEAGIISLIIVDLILIPISFSNFSWQISIPHIKEILYIGIPLAFSGIGVWILNLSDRYMIQFLLPESIAMSQVGIYSLGDKLALFIRFILVVPFMLTWGALMYSYAEKPNAKKIYSSVLNIFVFVSFLLAFFISIFAKEIITILANNSEFYPAFKVVPLLSFSKALSGVIFVVSVGVIITNKSYFVAIASFIGAVSNIIINYLLIPELGILGASIGSFLAYFFDFTIIYIIAQKFYYVDYEIHKIILFFVTVAFSSIFSVVLNLPLLIRVLLFIVILSTAPMFKLVTYKNIWDFIKTSRKFISKWKK